ncbi:aspartyl-phosphate phosphatase Spo0E family protein [Paenibacillus sp. GYB003]|uniref:aspartyl-phosphate phosphatase Spo0E family protein n=1 Tax=Paenibacillus sp. GYB003 TaxID=2994392 RepID=UPI002F964D94
MTSSMLLKEIERVRMELNEVPLNDPTILTLSERLDLLLNEYYTGLRQTKVRIPRQHRRLPRRSSVSAVDGSPCRR